MDYMHRSARRMNIILLQTSLTQKTSRALKDSFEQHKIKDTENRSCMKKEELLCFYSTNGMMDQKVPTP